MKLLTYDSGSGPRCGVLRGDDVVDVADLLGVNQPLQDVRALLELSESAVAQVRTALASNSAAPSVPLASVQLRSPVLQPPTVRDYMIYEEHATGQGTRTREEAWYRMPISSGPSRGTVAAQEVGANVFVADVYVERESLLLLKATCHPNWRATVDGVETRTVMLVPIL